MAFNQFLENNRLLLNVGTKENSTEKSAACLLLAIKTDTQPPQLHFIRTPAFAAKTSIHLRHRVNYILKTVSDANMALQGLAHNPCK